MAEGKKNGYKDKKRQKHRKLLQSNVANGGLTPKIQAVLRHYFDNGYHQDQAMLSAGYAESSAKNSTHIIFGRPDVKRAIEEHEQELNRKFEVNEEWVIRRLMIIAEGNPGLILLKLRQSGYDLSKLSDAELYFLNEFTEKRYKEDGDEVIELKLKGADRLAALQMLARKLGLFKDQVEVTGLGSIVERLQAGRNRAAARNKKE